MSCPIGVLGAFQDKSEKPYRHLSRADAALEIRRQRIFWIIEHRLARDSHGGTWDGWLGTGNAIPFGKVQNKLLKPSKLHYAVPAIADHRQAWLNSFMTPEKQPTTKLGSEA